MTNTDHLLLLNAISGLGPLRIKKLLERFGSPQNILKASERDLSACRFLPPQVASAIRQFPADNFLKEEYALLKKHNAFVVSIFDPFYSARLKEISDPPMILYGKGNVALMQEAIVALVGCRKSSVYGMTIAERLAQDLCDYNIVVASGLARGIDTAVHRGTVKAKGKTIAVLGNGLSHVYPPENKRLFDAIAERGLLVSELTMATLPKPYQFPRRNRIISGLSLGVVVVEAARKSGALITADLALEQGRDVFAVPGKVDCVSSCGVHDLIKQGAKLVTCAQDIVEELSLEICLGSKDREKACKKTDASAEKHLSRDEQNIFMLLSKDPVDVDYLCEQSRLPIFSILNILVRLEILGLVRQLPGKLFVIR